MSGGEGPGGRTGQVGRIILAAFLVPGMYFTVVEDTHNATLGVAAVLGLVVFLAGVLLYERRKGRSQVEAIEATWTIEIDGALDFACLPGRWPDMANETLSSMTAARA